MIEATRRWLDRYFSDPQVVTLAIMLVGGGLVFLWVDNLIAPVLVAIVLAYLLEGLVAILERWGAPRFLAVMLVFSGFIIVGLVVIFVMLPVIIEQVRQLVTRMPDIILAGQKQLMQLPERYPSFITADQVKDIIGMIRERATAVGSNIVSGSLAQATTFFAIVIYLVMVPLMVFFFLKDKRLILDWVAGYFPEDMQLTNSVLSEVDGQIANYTRGKLLEVLIVGGVSFVTFTVLNLQFAPLLSLMVGLSVLVPFIGAAVVTAPVLIVAAFQFGITPDFWYVFIAYSIIQALDGNVLVPVLFSEVVNLHPIAIVVAVLFFGGLWGLGGVFFAIPLATLVQAVLKAWPRKRTSEIELSTQ